jgi:putative ATPase subunit of terminase (gpP-like)
MEFPVVSVSERRAEATQLRDVEGWSNKQIARHLGVHPSTVGRWFTPAISKEETP